MGLGALFTTLPMHDSIPNVFQVRVLNINDLSE